MLTKAAFRFYINRSMDRFRTMATNIRMKDPPATVKGMTIWNPEAFVKSVQIPYIEIEVQYVGAFNKYFKKYVLKMPNLPYVLQTDDEQVKRILLDPDLVKTVEDFPPEFVDKLERFLVPIKEGLKFQDHQFTLTNWKPAEMLDAVLLDPERGIPSMSSYAIIGHIAHVNLKDYHLPHKFVIGNILLLIKQIRTVVNKTTTIDNTFRNFCMEVLAGEKDDFLVSVKENGCKFEFDFSKVYWNPKLCTEHERLVDRLGRKDILFDVFAGVGPFAIPAAKKCHRVFANDLNPDSFNWLQKNLKLNKINEAQVQCFNLDGREFIRTVLRKALIDEQLGEGTQIHVVMNLPALAVEFLDAFYGLLSGQELTTLPTPIVHVYAFSKETDNPKVQLACEKVLNCSLENVDVAFVRKVAPSKEMFRVSFPIPRKVLFAEQDCNDAKRLKLK